MKALFTTILILITLSSIGQIIWVTDAENLHRGKQVYQIVMKVSDTTIKTVYWQVVSGTGMGSGNDGLAFCFGQPALFDKRIPDTTGVLRVYNPEPIIKRGVYKSWKIKVIAYNPLTNYILYEGIEELMFSKLPTE
jgi:hypothetical protein